ncbi:hypothetical protein PIROE2DRAFT_16586 [Piromyces sp. E2]|nr:hypothetical protein PIROE2DRAFT_16586 [Piromyces sp. E2]|eukprot:OUM58212.1 hypothetical protein PIROE2DRAFT_16586 [Piromyces sp. E2]
MGFKCPEYKSIESQITRNINKQLTPDIETFEEIPDESKYYKTERSENLMIFKNHNLAIFQSPFQAKLFSYYYEYIFADGTFYAAPKFSNQLFITRTYVSKINMFYTTSISILKNKQLDTYEPINSHCDFEIGISNAAKKVFPNINIKYYFWHYKRSLEKQKNELCYNEVENNNNLKTYYKAILNFPFINPEYIFDICMNIEIECRRNNYNDF